MPKTPKLNELLTAIVASSEDISDILFIPGKPPQAEMNGVLETPSVEWPAPPDDIAVIERFARDIIDGNTKLQQDIADRGSCDCSYSLPDCRFRVNIYRECGSFAIVLRLLKPMVPTISGMGFPAVFNEVIKERGGITFVTGASGTGKTTTLAALLNEINLTRKVHVITLEDPIEFVYSHALATFSQRELGRDFFTFADGMRSALRQAPKVVLVGEIRDRESMEIALNASETGLMVYSTLHTIGAGQTINRVLGMFQQEEERQVRERLATSLRYVIGQRLVPCKKRGRLLITEVMGHNLRTQETIALGENDLRRFSEIIEAGKHAGWHTFEQSLLQAYENDLITEETAMVYATNRPAMRRLLDTASRPRQFSPENSLRLPRPLPGLSI
jgi:twitching motility protein PilT